MSDELGFITASLQRIESKIDEGLMQHENRISRLEGGLSLVRWIVGITISVAAVIAAAAGA